MDKEKIKKAIDHFENDEYSDSKEILQKEIKTKYNDHLNKELDLENSDNDDDSSDDSGDDEE